LRGGKERKELRGGGMEAHQEVVVFLDVIGDGGTQQPVIKQVSDRGTFLKCSVTLCDALRDRKIL
jgi:orotate phosphoribosyltransferase-like protein